MPTLFVYGTLAPGRSNHHVMADIAGDWCKASLRGFLMDEGWGAQMGYPGIVPSPDGQIVEGYALLSDELDQHWQRLDEFEGGGYQRVTVTIQLTDGSTLDAFVYALKD